MTFSEAIEPPAPLKVRFQHICELHDRAVDDGDVGELLRKRMTRSSSHAPRLDCAVERALEQPNGRGALEADLEGPGPISTSLPTGGNQCRACSKTGRPLPKRLRTTLQTKGAGLNLAEPPNEGDGATQRVESITGQQRLERRHQPVVAYGHRGLRERHVGVQGVTEGPDANLSLRTHATRTCK